MPFSLLSPFRDFLRSKYCIHIRLWKHCMWFTTAWPMNQLAQSSRFWMTSGQFLSAGTGLASFIRNNIPSRVLATVRSQILGFRGRRCLNSWLTCVSVSKQFSFKISLRQSLISLSTLTWFGPPRGLSAILPSLTYLDTILLAVDLHLQLLDSPRWHLQRLWLSFRGVQTRFYLFLAFLGKSVTTCMSHVYMYMYTVVRRLSCTQKVS